MLKMLHALNEAVANGIDHFTVHCLRRTMNNLLRQFTQGPVEERMTELYGHVGHEEKAKAIEQVVARVFGTATPPTTEVGLGGA